MEQVIHALVDFLNYNHMVVRYLLSFDVHPWRVVSGGVYVAGMTTPAIVLVPGFWLGGWAWDEVGALLTGRGHDVTAVTLPGLDSVDTDRSSITLLDHVDAICEVIAAKKSPVVLAVHSGAGVPGYAVTDRVPELIAHAVYVDTGPATGALDPDFAGDEYPLPSWDDLAEDPANSVALFTNEQRDRFQARAVPEPAGALRDSPTLVNDGAAQCSFNRDRDDDDVGGR